VIENIINGESGRGRRNDTLQIGVDTLPVLPRDATDRNRTSPFAFTGNKFEFRAPGSAQSCAGPMMTLNTIVAEAFDSLAEELSSFAPETFLAQLQETLKRRISEHKRIIFNGDNYSEEWVKEAERRGLPNLKNTMTALHTLVNEKNVALFEKYGVFSRRELESRFEIFLEEYHRRIRIEGRLSWEMAATIILPALRNEYKQTVSALSRALDAKRTNGTAALQKLADKLGDALDSVVSDLDTLETALTSCHEDILAAMSRLRTSVDAAETLVNDRSWPLPKYREMLFIY
jgi:glutamine synthetase